jgi:ribosomal protein S18 acetylase RimI-like enzyme
MPPTLSFHPASRLGDEALAALFTAGYAGYYTPVTVDAAAFRAMVTTGDLDLGASRVGTVAGEPVAFALLGVRGTRGWIGGMGVVGAQRGHGYGCAAMEAVLESGRARGLERVDLEVLEQNTPAFRIYEALGFRERRLFDVLVREPAPLPPGPTATPALEALTIRECLALHPAFHPARPPWQRDLPSLEHWAARLEAVGMRDATGIACWVLYRRDGMRLNLADLALAQGRPKGWLEAVLRSLIGAQADSTLMLVNIPADDPSGEILRALGATVKFRQREMTLAL